MHMSEGILKTCFIAQAVFIEKEKDSILLPQLVVLIAVLNANIFGSKAP